MHLAAHQFPAPGSTLPPVVLLHGFASSAAEDFIATGWPESLNAAGRNVIAIDLPGHGRSPALDPDAQATTDEVVRAILDAAGEAMAVVGAIPAGGTVPAGGAVAPDRAAASTVGSLTGPNAEREFDVIGYSLGARLAWELPRRAPQLRRLVLGGVSPFEPFAAVDPQELAAVLAGGTSSNPLVGMMAAMITAPGRDTASLARLIPGLASQPFAPESSSPQVPTLLAAGAADQLAQGIEALASGLPRAELVSVPGDHRGALDSPEFRAAAIEFLAR